MNQPLWAPWRVDYITSPKSESCVFCLPDKDISNNEQLLVLYRGTTTFVIMNKFPYNNGHIMVVPLRHINDFMLLTDEESFEIIKLLQHCIHVLKIAMNPQGFNVGLNLGETAGSGIKDHLHFHIVPRWNGDVSFISVTSETRVISEHILSTYRKLKPLFTSTNK